MGKIFLYRNQSKIRNQDTGKEADIDGQKQEIENPAQFLMEIAREHKAPVIPGMPNLTGGLIGYFGYDMIRYIEKSLKNVPEDDLQMPDCHLCMYDQLIAYDHLSNKVIIIQNIHQGDPVEDIYEELEDRAELILRKMERPVAIQRDRFLAEKPKVTLILRKRRVRRKRKESQRIYYER